VVAEDLFLLVCYLREEGVGGCHDVVDVDLFVFVVEEAFSDNACEYGVSKCRVGGLELTYHR
jgi:hypothetical protein